MTKKRKGKICIPLVIAIYLMIFNPPILSFRTFLGEGAEERIRGTFLEKLPMRGFNWIWVMILASLIYVLVNRKFLKEYVDIRAVVCAEAILGVMLVYLMAVAYFNGNPVTYFGYVVYWMAGDIPFALAAWICLRKRGQGVPELLDHLLAAGMAMAATSVLAFTVPFVKDFFTWLMENYGIPYTELLAPYRNQGLAANLTSTASYVQALLASVALYRAVRGKKAWYAGYLLLAFSSNINTRSSVIFLLAGMSAVAVALLNARKIREFWKFAGIMAVSVGVAFGGLHLVKAVNPMTYEWVTKGMNQIAEFASGKEAEEGYFSELKMFTDQSMIPRGTKLFFGEGMSILMGRNEVYSDVGFINDLWRGGLVYSVAVIGLYILALWKIMHSKAIARQDGVFLSGLLLLVFLLNNVKGSFFIHSDVTVVLWLLIPALVWNREAVPRKAALTVEEIPF